MPLPKGQDGFSHDQLRVRELYPLVPERVVAPSMRRAESTFLPALLALSLTAIPLWLAPTFFAWQVLAMWGRYTCELDWGEFRQPL